MNDFTNLVPSAATLVRWGARLLGVGILLFWGYFILAHVFGDDARHFRGLAWQDSVVLTALGVSLAGLAVAWKWELTGGVMTLMGVLVGALVNRGMISGPYVLIPIAAMMYLLSWCMSRAPGRKQAVRT
jgi:hypothetical protein